MLHIEVTQADITKARKLAKTNDWGYTISKMCPVVFAVARKQKKIVSVGCSVISLCNGRRYIIDKKGQNFIDRFDSNQRVRPIKFTATLEAVSNVIRR